MLHHNTENYWFPSIKQLNTYFSTWIWYFFASLGHRLILQVSTGNASPLRLWWFCLIRYHSSSPVLLHLHKFLITSGTTPVIIQNLTFCWDIHLWVIGSTSPFLLQMLWKPWRGALFLTCTFFLWGKLSQLHVIMLSPSPSPVSLGSDLPSQHSIAGSLFGMLWAAGTLRASLVHRRRQEREGFCHPSCSKDRPTSVLSWVSKDKTNQRALKEMGKLRHHSLQQVPGEGGSLFSPELKEFFAFFFDYPWFQPSFIPGNKSCPDLPEQKGRVTLSALSNLLYH